MKILIVSHEYPPIGGGGANACMCLAREYAKAGNDVAIVTAWFPGLPEREEIAFPADGGGKVMIHRLHAKRKHKHHCGFWEMADYILKSLPYACKLNASGHFDVCQVFFGVPSGVIGYWLKKRQGLPYVIRLGGGDIPGFQLRFAWVYKMVAPFIKLFWRHASAVVANSVGLRSFAEKFYNRREILVIPNGADLRAFGDEQAAQGNEAAATNADHTITLLFVGRLIERKGLQDVLPCLREVNDACERQKLAVRLLIVGDGPYRGALERLVAESGVGGLVEFCGQKDKHELPYYYSRADVFIFPSRNEGMPNAVLEAMSYGLPIVMTPCQGSDELIAGNGYIAEAKDFGQRLVGLATDAAERQRMGAASVRLIETTYNWQNIAKEYMSLFKNVTPATVIKSA